MTRATGPFTASIVAVAEWARRRPVRVALVLVAVTCDAVLLGGLGDSAMPPPLDLRLAYMPGEARRFLAAATPAQRARMIEFGSVDLVFLAAYGLLLLGLARSLLDRLARAGRAVRGVWPYGLALSPALADLVESATILAVNRGLQSGRAPVAAVYGVMAAATPLKWLGFLAVAGWMLLAWRRGRAA